MNSALTPNSLFGRKTKAEQLDLFGHTETVDDKIHVLKCKQEKVKKSFFVRYNIVIKELDEIQEQIRDLEDEIKSGRFSD